MALRRGVMRPGVWHAGPNQETDFPLNNQRSNNRRRGRGNNRGGGGGNQSNRIDSRARGNAPQMLEKYKKLANDAALNDDRVQTEYYLQFADHYFRVIADIKAQKDEQRPKREGDRDQNDGDGDDDDNNDRDNDRDEERGRKSRSRSRRGNDSDDNGDRHEERGRKSRSRSDRGSDGDGEDDDREPSSDNDGDNSANENPFQRGNRRKSRAGTQGNDAGDSLDPGTLPPAISRDDKDDAGGKDAGEKKPAKPRARRSRPKDDAGDEETLQAANS